MKDVPENAKVLLVPFAKDTEKITSTTEKVADEFKKSKWQKKIVIEVADEQNFMHQLQSADVVYFHGGVSLRLLETLKKYPGLEQSLKGKTVAGESAGANVLCRYFYSPHADSIFEGLGFLPLKIIPHYKKDFEGKIEGVGHDLKELLLPEYKYDVFLI